MESTSGTKTTRFTTRIDLNADERQSLIELLNQHLADLVDLRSQIKQAHWNVRGPRFFPLHELFDELAERLLEPIDDLAERVGALGGLARGSVRMSAANTRLTDFDEHRTQGLDVTDAVADRIAYVAEKTRRAIDQSSNIGDETTADLFTEISRGLDESLWFIEAHLQEETVEQD
jgi:starvation-inducible DNA-binding protein